MVLLRLLHPSIINIENPVGIMIAYKNSIRESYMKN